jgi:neurofibromin 1
VWLLQFLNQNTTDNNPQAQQLRNLASEVLFALSLNNFTAVFNKISAKYVAYASFSKKY